MVDTKAAADEEKPKAEKPVEKLKVRKAQLDKALKAILQVIAKQQADQAADLGQKQLFGSVSKSLHVIFFLSWMPERRKFNPRLINLPHPMYTENSDVCVLCKDSCKKLYKELLVEKKQVPGVSKVISVDKLQRQYKLGKDQHVLADAFDLFVCDDRIYHMMWEKLGVNFKSGNKYPTPVKIRADDEDPCGKIKKAMSSTLFRPTEGMQVTVKIGRSNMDQEALLNNACAVIKAALPFFAENPVQKICVQGHNTPMLPIWSRPRPGGPLLKLQKYKEGLTSASETASSGAPETEDTGSSIEITSDAGETISVDLSTGEATSELETATDSDFDAHAGNIDEESIASEAQEEAPPERSTKGKKRRKEESKKAAPVEEEPPVETKKQASTETMMPPPKKKAKKKANA
mmetsp:Transcript_10121/g.22766  ORF Transcript_10121/g.22766 Transcript_10121/m.22766 type:complete len:404 (-) Transcript_10121:106-1317(-)